VKVRGYRIELGEVEAALCAHEDVRQAVVSTHELDAADVRLLAYVVPRDGAQIDDASLRSALRATLPAYMVPQHFIALPRLPVGANGKVDRNALPLPDADAPGAGRPTTPASETEQRVASIWSEVLDRKEVDTRANFFDVGGHSILATRLLARINRDFGVDLPFVRLFTEPTVADISRNIEAMMRTDRPDGREETEF
jgi:acyl carrier protein